MIQLNKCPYCGANIKLVDSEYVYGNKKHYGKMYVCSNFPSCDSYVGCHPNSTMPLGRVANKKLRRLKREAHIEFDAIWKSKLMSRRDAYEWLSNRLDKPLVETHIGMFDVSDCKKTIEICRNLRNSKIIKYRKSQH